jgi:hypothetical protein
VDCSGPAEHAPLAAPGWTILPRSQSQEQGTFSRLYSNAATVVIVEQRAELRGICIARLRCIALCAWPNAIGETVASRQSYRGPGRAAAAVHRTADASRAYPLCVRCRPSVVRAPVAPAFACSTAWESTRGIPFRWATCSDSINARINVRDAAQEASRHTPPSHAAREGGRSTDRERCQHDLRSATYARVTISCKMFAETKRINRIAIACRRRDRKQ